MSKNKRYFSYSASDKPGVGKLSPQLREALSLKDDMLPFWIYRMRILGYPPTWMKVAESAPLDIHDGSKPNSSYSDFRALEDGEIEEKLKYNKDMLIEFPGFNSPVPENVKDDWLLLGVPPYQKNQQLSVATQGMTFLEPVPYKRMKTDNSNDSDTNSDNKTNESEKVTENQDGSSSKTIKPDKDPTTDCSSLNKSDQNVSTTSLDRIPKLVSIGTPITKTKSLPNIDAWSTGIDVDFLYHENLPNATGAYKNKLKGLLNKISNRFNKK